MPEALPTKEKHMNEWYLPELFSFKGHKIRYGIFGHGTPLVIVHGTPWSSFNLRHLIKGLSQHYKVYTFDLLGYGQSEKCSGDVSLGIQNQLLNELTEYWQLDNPYIVGHDFGGTTVLRSHILNKRDFHKIVVIDPVALSPWGSPFFQHIRNYEEAFAGVPAFIHKAIVEAYIKTAAHAELPPHTIVQTLAPWSDDDGQAAFYRQIAQADEKYTDEFQDRFDEMRSDLLIIWGEKDKWIPISQAYELQRRIKGAQLFTVPDSGHLVIEERPGILVETIRAFFND